jgi:hypothetical protein
MPMALTTIDLEQMALEWGIRRSIPSLVGTGRDISKDAAVIAQSSVWVKLGVT